MGTVRWGTLSLRLARGRRRGWGGCGALSLLKLDARRCAHVGTEEPAGGSTGRFLCRWRGEGARHREAALPHSPLCSGPSGLLVEAQPPQLVAHVHPEDRQLPSLLLGLAPLPLK